MDNSPLHPPKKQHSGHAFHFCFLNPSFFISTHIMPAFAGHDVELRNFLFFSWEFVGFCVNHYSVNYSLLNINFIPELLFQGD